MNAVDSDPHEKEKTNGIGLCYNFGTANEYLNYLYCPKCSDINQYFYEVTENQHLTELIWLINKQSE